MKKVEWMPTYGQKPRAAYSLDYVWVQYGTGEVELLGKDRLEDWGTIVYWKPTQIRNPKPYKPKYESA